MDDPTSSAARLASGSPPWAAMCSAASASSRARRAGVRAPDRPGSQRSAGRRPRPGAERGDELVAGDHPVLEREQSEEEMAIGGGGHGEAPVHDVVPPKSGLGTAPESGHKGRRRIEVILA